MTIENAIKVGILADRLDVVNNSLNNAENARNNVSGVPYKLDIRFDDNVIYSVSESIAMAAIDLIIKRLTEERDKITAEIEAM